MRIRLTKPYGFCKPGDVLEPDEPVARLLIERGIAERVEEPMEEAPSPIPAIKGKKSRRSR